MKQWTRDNDTHHMFYVIQVDEKQEKHTAKLVGN